MKNAKTRAQRRRVAMLRKVLLTFTLVMVVAMASIGGTVAWLTASTDTITNVFTDSNIGLTLEETKGEPDATLKDTWNFKMIPGNDIEKDPKVAVTKGSEASWVFVKIEEINDFDTYMTYDVDSHWTALTGVDGVYYREVADMSAATADETPVSVLAGDKVTVRNGITKEQMQALKASGKYPTLKFTAYAIQKASFGTAASAWAEVSK